MLLHPSWSLQKPGISITYHCPGSSVGIMLGKWFTLETSQAAAQGLVHNGSIKAELQVHSLKVEAGTNMRPYQSLFGGKPRSYT
jgi:hypothetical protein